MMPWTNGHTQSSSLFSYENNFCKGVENVKKVIEMFFSFKTDIKKIKDKNQRKNYSFIIKTRLYIPFI